MKRVRKKQKWLIVGLIIVTVLFVGSGAVWRKLSQPRLLLDSKITKTVPFNIVHPTTRSGVTVNAGSVQYNASEQLFVFEGEYQNARSRLVFSQQSLPDELKDSGAFKEMVEPMAVYANFNSQFGQVYMTKPPSQGERQSAVLKTDNSLVFILAVDNLTDDQWRGLIDSLVLQEPKSD